MNITTKVQRKRRIHLGHGMGNCGAWNSCITFWIEENITCKSYQEMHFRLKLSQWTSLLVKCNPLLQLKLVIDWTREDPTEGPAGLNAWWWGSFESLGAEFRLFKDHSSPHLLELIPSMKPGSAQRLHRNFAWQIVQNECERRLSVCRSCPVLPES